MPQPVISFREIIDCLVQHYGAPEPPVITDPLELIIWENIAYLSDDKRRAAAFEELKRKVGTEPEKILKADRRTLLGVAKAGILADLGVEKLLTIAKTAYEDFNGNLWPVLKLSLPQAKQALKKFPSIGDPGAEKILLFTRAYPIMALESNGLRVLLRIGFGVESKNYAASYRSVQQALREQLSVDCSSLIRAHQVLRQHGQTLCKRTRPLCDCCPVRDKCTYFLAMK
jgi:endonuclease III